MKKDEIEENKYLYIIGDCYDLGDFKKPI